MSIAGLILAAGRAIRFGRDKRQALMPDGRSMLETVLAAYAAEFDQVFMVTRPDDAFGQSLANALGARVLVNEKADQGMGQSLACGARALMQRPEVSGVVVGMADMPAVQPATLKALRQALRKSQAPVVPVYKGLLGQPRGLPRASFEALRQLSGDQGARQLLDWHQAMAVPVDDPGVLLDADTPEDMALVLKQLALDESDD